MLLLTPVHACRTSMLFVKLLALSVSLSLIEFRPALLYVHEIGVRGGGARSFKMHHVASRIARTYMRICVLHSNRVIGIPSV